MRTLSLIALAVAVTIALRSSDWAHSSAAIEGTVLDAATGHPLPGVQIELAAVVPAATATTDAQGHFSIETTQAGRLRVVPTLNGYIYSRPGRIHAPVEPGVWVQVSSGDHIKDLEIKMERSASISGRVLNADGLPISGTAGTVSLQRYSYGTDGKRTLASVPGISYPGRSGSSLRMDDRGEFRFYGLPPGEYYLSVSGGGGAIGASNLYFYPGTRDESKAVPIRVTVGDDIQLGTLSLPPRQSGTPVTFRVKGPVNTGNKQVYIGDSMIVLTSAPIPDEIALPSIAQGHYDIVISSGYSLSLLQYASIILDVGSSKVEEEVELQQGAAVSGTIMIEDAAGKRTEAPNSIRCKLHSHYGVYNCSAGQVVPATYEIEFDGLPADAYVLSVKANDLDTLTGGLNISGDTALQIVLGSSSATAQGTIRDTDGNLLSDAVVALVPDAPYRNTGLLHRSVISDPNGKFEIHGIAPGSYKLFAWSELEGAGYRNADFMKEFDSRGKPVEVEKGSQLFVDLTAFESSETHPLSNSK